MDFNPVSTFTVLKPAPSMVSVFDKLCTISDSKPHFEHSDTDSDSQSEILEIDPNNKLMDTLLDNNSTGTDSSTPENNTHSDNCITNTVGQGCVASQAHQNMASVSTEICAETEGHSFPAIEESESFVLDLEEGAQNDDVWNSEMEPTIASKVVEKTTSYVRSEDLLEDSCGPVSALNLNDHIPESNAPSLDNSIMSTIKQGYVDSEACQTMASVFLDIPAAKCLAVDRTDTVANNFKQSSSYVRSEDLLEASCGPVTTFNLSDHIPASDIPTVNNSIMSASKQGYVDSEAYQTMADGSTEIFSRTDNIFPASEEPVSLALELDEDDQNIPLEIEPSSHGDLCPAFNCSAIDTGASNFVEQSSNYVRSEDLLEGHESVFVFDSHDHIFESDIPSSLDNCITSTNKQGYVDAEACQTMASVSLDIPAAKHSSAIDQNDSPASNFVEQSSSYVRSEDLLEGHCELFPAFDHTPGGDILNCVMNTNERGYVDSKAHQSTTSASPEIFVRTDDNIFPASEEPVSLALDLDEDDENIPLEIEPSSHRDLCPAFNCSAVDTGASNFVEKSSNYVRSEDLLEGRESVFVFDSNDHIFESNALTLDNCITSTNKQGYVDAEACQTMASVSLDIPAAKCSSAIDQNDSPASNFVEQSSNYVCSEDLYVGSREFVPAFDHIPESDVPSLDSCIMTTNEQGYVDSEACQNMTSVSPGLFVERETGNFATSEETVSLVLDLDEDNQNNNSEQEPPSGDSYCPDIPPSSWFSATEPSPGDCSKTATSNPVNSNYICTEDLLVGRHGTVHSELDSNDHICDSEFLPSICLGEEADHQSLSTMELESKNNRGYYVPPNELLKPSSSYLSETSLLASARPDVLSIKDPKASSLHSGTEDSLSISTMSPQSVFSEHYRTIPHQTFGYFDYTTNSFSSPLKMQLPSTSSGYITDNSTAGDEVPFSMEH